MSWFKKLKELFIKVANIEQWVSIYNKEITELGTKMIALECDNKNLETQLRDLDWKVDTIGQLTESNVSTSVESNEDFAVRSVMFIGQDISTLIGKEIIVSINPYGTEVSFESEFYTGKCVSFGVNVRNDIIDGKVDYVISKYIVLLLSGKQSKKIIAVGNNTSIRLK